MIEEGKDFTGENDYGVEEDADYYYNNALRPNLKKGNKFLLIKFFRSWYSKTKRKKAIT